MKFLNFLIFFSIVLTIHSAINYYIIRRGLEIIPLGSPLRKYFVMIVIFLAASFVIGRILENFTINIFTSSLIWIGSFWLAIMTYLFLSILVIDLIRVVNHFINITPSFITNNVNQFKQWIGIFVLGLTSVVVITGHINTRIINTKELNIKLQKDGGNLKKLRAAVFSDIHLGTIIGRKHLQKILKILDEKKPDIILIPGDIIDEDIKPVLKYNIGEVLLKFKAKYGVYAVTGNHEYIGGVKNAKKYLAEHNINLLNDEYKLIDSSFYLIGREDRAISQFNGGKRRELGEIMDGIDKAKPMILMDHQPFNLEQAEQNGIDLQLSGHTHHGQLWPFNFITKAVYELSWGYLQKGNTHYYVSCGIGGWGPPVRTGSRPELIIFNIEFE
ncbi:MAG: metallophosphoesterase [Ignavibacteria bacterium]|nr:MAG: metallophosphoesterase [Ignavibacteria bacterium]